VGQSDAILKQIQKQFGEASATQGAEYENPPRLPTGIFPFDLATGGGFPRGKISIVYGPESSGKTNIVLKAVAMHQTIYPDQKVVFVDIENSFDPEWAKRLGVKVEDVIMLYPAYAEQCVDMVEMLLQAEDVGLVVVDSIAAMITAFEVESSAEKAIVAGNAVAVQKLTKKSIYALGDARKVGRHPTMICINQIRYKIGVMYGDPETLPGGKALPFQSAMTVRLYGKNELDKSISKTMPILKVTSCILRKWKCPVVSASFEYKMVTIPHKGLSVGQVDDWNTVQSYLRNYGWLKKDGQHWDMVGNKMKTLEECRQLLLDNPEQDRALRTKIIQRAVAESSGLPVEFDMDDPDNAA
jgi:recombination protein RecA